MLAAPRTDSTRPLFGIGDCVYGWRAATRVAWARLWNRLSGGDALDGPPHGYGLGIMEG